MVFSSYIFLSLFLPIFLVAYYIAPIKLRNWVALGASLLFYAWGAPTLVILLVLSCTLDFTLSKPLTNSQHRSAALTLGVSANLLLLGYFKYSNFFIDQLNTVISNLGSSPISWTAVALPVGISFFTFQKISYLVDLYRGNAAPARSLGDYILYVVLFPQLIAGPIVRYHDVATQIVSRTHSAELFNSGIIRFSVGLAKKVLIADQMGEVADHVFALSSNQLTTGYAWLGITAYAFQIYYDFSGYSDMAIGLGRMIGFQFLENFNFPYTARTITEFWRRWHISLSNFMKEYLYIPLGGNRGSTARTYLNLWLVFLLSGLWHGAAWNFVVWGAYHGTFLVLDRLFWSRIAAKLPRVLSVLITFVIVLGGWVFFRAETLTQALAFFEILLGISSPSEALLIPQAEIIHHRALIIFIGASLCIILGAFISSEQISKLYRSLKMRSSWQLAEGAFSIAALLFVFFALATTDFSPFLYFRF